MENARDRRRRDDQEVDGDTPDVSAWSIGANVGTSLLVVLAGLALYVVGGVLVYTSIIQPGSLTAVAIAYLLLAVVTPIAIARKMRSRGSPWRRIGFVSALIVLAVSVLFFPFAALPMSM